MVTESRFTRFNQGAKKKSLWCGEKSVWRTLVTLVIFWTFKWTLIWLTLYLYISIPRKLYDEVDDLLSNQWIQKSHSAYTSPMVYVRINVVASIFDYQKLNNKTITEKQPIPKMQHILDSLGGHECFSTVDMSKAYHHGYIKEEYQKFTAFSTPWALYEWIRIPYSKCIAYLDNILIYGRTFEDHLESLEAVLKRLKEKGVKLNSKKCHFFKQEFKYLGRLICKDRYRADPKDAIALETFRAPLKTVGELNLLLGFLGYYRFKLKKFIKLWTLIKKGRYKTKIEEN